MRVFRGLDSLPKFKNAVLTIGTYDGVHLGHQHIVHRINDLAKNIEGESILLTFYPHPRLILHPEDNTLKLITTIDEKIELLEGLGLQNLVILPFSNDLANLEAEDYIKNILIKYFNPSYICVGYDHKFGKGRTGDYHLLEQLKDKYQYQLEEIPAQTIDEISVSSTKVRKALLEGNIKIANQFLSHPFSIKSKVIHGNKVGRLLGFPTANIDVADEHKLIPASGVYAVWVKIDNQLLKGALSIGYRETVFDNSELTIEVFILDFNQMIYDKSIELIFVDYVRPQIKYDNWELLQDQIKKDVQQVEHLLS
ncbi:MAG: bifunctional riboflavin kinase/FAD synthetase [Sphingobacteriales bacterium]|jgi:riboflavin kinase/FMN adenylyltransferase|nr:MAG: bifunctional riboflavin kinase/FAD synthetase [Sphingobacteriales bacterium]